jgi:ribose transport system ATP-binding protein
VRRIGELSDEIVLSVKDIVKQFPGVTALNNVSLSVRKGEAHALVGENGAGKSTLMNIIGGVYPANSGTVEFLGRQVRFQDTKQAQDAGIGFVHQELNLCTHLSAAENIYMGNMPKSATGIDWKKLYADADEQLKMLNADFKSNAKISSLTVAQQQIVEIVKALSKDVRLLILDEPTSSLTEQESKLLFKVVGEIKNRGIGILYISHRMEEIFEVCESLTVLRDGELVNSLGINESTVDQIVQMMVGREITDMYPAKSEKIGDVFFEVKNFTREGVFKDVSFQVRKGEILGFYGLVGAGRSEAMRSICAIDPHQSGELYLEGKKVEAKEYKQMIDLGVSYITEDRKAQGLFLYKSLVQNMTAAILEKVSKGIFIRGEKEKEIAEEYSKLLAVKYSSLNEDINDLSGGNQQKVMIGKWLATGPRLLVLDEPTRGIDVGAKSEIHKLLRKLCDEGVCIVIISSELPEVMGLSDRVVIMHEGEVCGEVAGDEVSEETIIVYASGVRDVKENAS